MDQARSSHRFEGSNEPPFVRQVSLFFSCSLYERALSCHHTAFLQLKQRNLVERDVDCQRVHVCTIAVRWASPRPRLRCDQRRSSLALRAGPLRVVQKKHALDEHFSSSSIVQHAVCHSCKILQSTMKRTNESDMDGQAKLFSFDFS